MTLIHLFGTVTLGLCALGALTAAAALLYSSLVRLYEETTLRQDPISWDGEFIGPERAALPPRIDFTYNPEEWELHAEKAKELHVGVRDYLRAVEGVLV